MISSSDPDALIINLEGFEGPLDLLLDLARAQKLDMAKISILSVVTQFLAVIEGARRVRLELAADWLVMAAWLTWLKSRLLLPPEAEAAEDAEVAAEALAGRLRALAAMRAAAAWLDARPMLGRDVFARGAPENFVEHDRSQLAADAPSLVRAYLAARRRGGASRTWQPSPPKLWTMQDALDRLRALVGTVPDWSSLEMFMPTRDAMPPTTADAALALRAARASTLLAGLELARAGALRLRQHADFAPILVGPPAR